MEGKSETRQERRQSERELRKSYSGTDADTGMPLSLRKIPLLPIILSLIVGIGLALAGVKIHARYNPQQTIAATKKSTVHIPNFSSREKTYGNVLELTPHEVPAADFAELNLLCGSGLNGTAGIDIGKCLKRLDQLVEMVRSETMRNWGHRKNVPAEYKNSEAYYKMGMLITVVRLDYKARYNPELIVSPTIKSNQDDGFYRNASDIFLQGLLSDRKMGTCSSIPVLYVAIGRRLGYPVHLVSTKGHLFCRWDDGKERLNFEGTGEGIRTDPDEKYMEWPFKITKEELVQSTYLKNLNPQQELAIFLSLRAECLVATDRNAEALTALSQALNLVQRNGGLSGIIEQFTFSPVIPDIVLKRKQEIINHQIAVSNLPNELQHPPIPHAPGIPPDPSPNTPNPSLPNLPFQPNFPQNPAKR